MPSVGMERALISRGRLPATRLKIQNSRTDPNGTYEWHIGFAKEARPRTPSPQESGGPRARSIGRPNPRRIVRRNSMQYWQRKFRYLSWKVGPLVRSFSHLDIPKTDFGHFAYLSCWAKSHW